VVDGLTLAYLLGLARYCVNSQWLQARVPNDAVSAYELPMKMPATTFR
jgi:hypothetical protein